MARQTCSNCGRVLNNMDFMQGVCISCKHTIDDATEQTQQKTPISSVPDINLIVNKENHSAKKQTSITTCPKCGRHLSQGEKDSGSCMICHYVLDESDASDGVVSNPLSQSDIVLTTAPFLDGYKVVKTIDIVAAECVIGMHFFKDLLSSFTDVFGGRSKTTQKTLKAAKQNCLSELRDEAKSRGANAVIGVDLDYSEISAQGKSMLFLVASGTAVKVEKNA